MHFFTRIIRTAGTGPLFLVKIVRIIFEFLQYIMKNYASVTYHKVNLHHESAFEPSGKKVCQQICTISQHTKI